MLEDLDTDDRVHRCLLQRDGCDVGDDVTGAAVPGPQRLSRKFITASVFPEVLGNVLQVLAVRAEALRPGARVEQRGPGRLSADELQYQGVPLGNLLATEDVGSEALEDVLHLGPHGARDGTRQGREQGANGGSARKTCVARKPQTASKRASKIALPYHESTANSSVGMGRRATQATRQDPGPSLRSARRILRITRKPDSVKAGAIMTVRRHGRAQAPGPAATGGEPDARSASLVRRDFLRTMGLGAATIGTVGVSPALAADGSVVPGSVVDVRDFGAKGDGVADDSLAIQAALDAIPARSAFDFATGTFRVSRRITLPPRPIRVLGQGATINAIHSTEVFYRNSRGHLFSMEGLTFTGTAVAFKYDAQDLGTPARPHGSEVFEYSIRNCSFLQASSTFALSLHGAREGIIAGCYFETNMGIYQDFSINTDIQNCIWKNTVYGVRALTGSEGVKILGGTMLGVGTGVWMGGAGNTTGLQVIGTMIDWCDYPILIQSGSAVLITGSYLSSRTFRPVVHVIKNARAQVPGRIKIMGNHLCQNDRSSATNMIVRVEDADDVLVLGNRLEAYRGNGIEYKNVKNLTIAFNSFDDNKKFRDTTEVAKRRSIAAGSNESTTKIHFNVLGNPLSVGTALDRFGNSGDGADQVVSGLQVSGGPLSPSLPGEGLRRTRYSRVPVSHPTRAAGMATPISGWIHLQLRDSASTSRAPGPGWEYSDLPS